MGCIAWLRSWIYTILCRCEFITQSVANHDLFWLPWVIIKYGAVIEILLLIQSSVWQRINFISLVVMSHEINAFSMSVFSRTCGRGLYTGSAKIHLWHKCRTSLVFTWRHYQSASEMRFKNLILNEHTIFIQFILTIYVALPERVTITEDQKHVHDSLVVLYNWYNVDNG